MKRFFGACATFALLSACAMPPEGVTPEHLAMFDEAVASIGCDLVSEEDFIPVELQTGMTRAQVQDVAAYKIKTEEGVTLSNGGFRLKTGACADAAA
ncbi:hypothetical protein [Puniceibacterium sediminis]|uniref:NADH dehydrogenase subunit E n=1 Tax=Puniceibacterium sediminis TaxID=1608407 RepID=A0A238W7N1_9RHOB|nr:hypothetical protein [Puniceibacterium sediminis]SNR42595.1 hypothetical protein SAMN06265370_104238 [Puniceibacterium sediminis]